jgi:hypothetical protein
LVGALKETVMPLALAKYVYLTLTILFLFGQQETGAPKGKGRSQNQQAPANQQNPTPQPQATPVQVGVEQPKAAETGRERQEQQKPAEGWFTPEWATALSNYLLLIFIVIQTAIYAYQLGEMRKMKGVSERQAVTMDAQAGAMQKQLEVMQDQAAAMQESLNESRISREIENRAFVTMKEVMVEGGLQTVVETGEVTIKLWSVNVGKTPAQNVRAAARAAFLPPVHNLQKLSGRVTEQSHAVLMPGVVFPGRVDTTVKKDTAEAELAEGKRLYVYGEIFYEDVFGKLRESKFCWYIVSSKKSYLGMCSNPDHNTVQ